MPHVVAFPGWPPLTLSVPLGQKLKHALNHNHDRNRDKCLDLSCLGHAAPKEGRAKC